MSEQIENITYPYNDDNMIFDENLNQYLLTETALMNYGVNLRARLSSTSGVSPESQINYAVYRVSNIIYGFIHEHNTNTSLQDYYLAKVPSLRQIIFKAMLAQALYMFNVGALDDSTDERLRSMAITNEAIRELNKDVPELRLPTILYTGRLPRCV